MEKAAVRCLNSAATRRWISHVSKASSLHHILTHSQYTHRRWSGTVSVPKDDASRTKVYSWGGESTLGWAAGMPSLLNAPVPLDLRYLLLSCLGASDLPSSATIVPTHIAAGHSHTLIALTAIPTTRPSPSEQIPLPRSTLLAFGLVTSGQLGLGTLGTASRPFVAGLVKMSNSGPWIPSGWSVRALAAGRQHSLVALGPDLHFSGDRAPTSSFAGAFSGHDIESYTRHDGSDVLFAFGSSTLGQLGLQRGVYHSPIQTFIPSASSHPLRIDALHAGMDHTLALTSSPSSLGGPTIWTTGWSADGQLGRPSTVPNVERDGFDSAWGAVDLSPLLAPSSSQNNSPANQPDIISISVGADYTLVMHTSPSSVGTATHPNLATWGNSEHSQGLLGHPVDAIAGPVEVHPLSLTPGARLASISAGGAFSLVLDTSSAVWVAGQGAGSLGLGEGVWEARELRKVHIARDDDRVVRVRAGHDRGYAVTQQGALMGWGSNRGGRLGLGFGVRGDVVLADKGGMDVGSGAAGNVAWEPREVPRQPRTRWVDVAVGGDFALGVAIVDE
ncbi:RCC1/BLIP-II protein [Gonapodya prolifera JEL478]|uniref:RCC1/BLIP-II protein n=1 Tax=Gonapodya prolifera (strain JEL478) TaxID=1344416 RepID=A0A139AG38_GONPJ|nr:RCC1/BLIP-II protein [Gonapodya prolifera JEL478]|eukprot:KXS15659.1 RCC1/BLIP-II protein [Gonapodya prolifera JEL478]